MAEVMGPADPVQPDQLEIQLDRVTGRPARVLVNGEELPDGTTRMINVDWDQTRSELQVEMTIRFRGRLTIREESRW